MAGIAVMLLLIVGTGAITILNATHAQSAALGEPIIVGKGIGCNSERDWP